MKLKDNRQIRNMTLLFALTYMVSYLTRQNYGAVISEIVASEGILKSQASLALTANALAYAVGQLISGFAGDRIQPRRLLLIGLLTSSLMNLLLPFCGGDPYRMLIVWSVNGFAQSFMWPPLVKLMSELFTDLQYQKSMMVVCWGSSVGTILVYVGALVCVSLLNWRSMFFFAAGIGAVMAVIWLFSAPNISLAPVSARKREARSGLSAFRPILPYLAVILLAIILHGAIRDSVTAWMPSYLRETYHLKGSIAIFTGVLLPVFALLCYHVAMWINRTKVTNTLLCAALFFAVAVVSAVLLWMGSGRSPALSVACSALLCGCMHGINLLLVCIVPLYFKRYGNISFISGLLNFSTYLGSSASTYGIALFSEHYDWKMTILLWAAIAFAGFALCISASQGWKKHQTQPEQN